MDQRTATDAALADVIHAWLSAEIPGDEDLVADFTQMAMSYRASGATVDETCAWVDELAHGWLRHHPAGPGPNLHLVAT